MTENNSLNNALEQKVICQMEMRLAKLRENYASIVADQKRVVLSTLQINTGELHSLCEQLRLATGGIPKPKIEPGEESFFAGPKHDRGEEFKALARTGALVMPLGMQP